MIHKMNEETTTIYFLEEELDCMQELLKLKAYKSAMEEESEWEQDTILNHYEEDVTMLFTQNVYKASTELLLYYFMDILGYIKDRIFVEQFKDVLRDAIEQDTSLVRLKEARLKILNTI